MLAVSQGLTAATPLVMPSEEFRRDTRAMLLATAEREGIGRTAKAGVPEAIISRPAVGRASVGTIHESAARRLLPKKSSPKARLTTNRARTRGAILVGLAVGTLALSGISAASGDAMPGSTLYGMKRQSESTQIALARSAASKGNLYLDFAHTRLVEAVQIGPASSAFVSTMTTMDQQTTEGANLLFGQALSHHDASALTAVNQFFSAQSSQLGNWEHSLPANSAGAKRALKSVDLLNRVHLRASEIASALKCTSTVKTIATDSLGHEPSCQEGALAAPTNTPAEPATPARHSNGGSTGTAATKPAEHGPAAAVTPKSTTAAAPASSPAVTPETAPSYDGGLLGSVEHLLGGL
ncbi:MAG TPA: DUF5667 domain-containing protein [Micromonosporaceae bacterium]